MIYLVADHGGYKKKQIIREWLKGRGHRIRDLGPTALNPQDDYPILASALARKIQADPKSFGIAICRTGIGMNIVANKFRGIRSMQAESAAAVKQARRDEDVNVITLAGDRQTVSRMKQLITAAISTRYQAAPRRRRRLAQISRLGHGR